MSTAGATSYRTIGWARRSLLIVAAAAAAAACGGDATSPGGKVPTSPVGTYDIQTVNGKPVPAVIAADGNYTQEITGSTISLTAGGAYSTIVTSRITIPGNVQIFRDSSAGTWVQSGTSIQLTSTPDALQDAATWNGGLLTFVEIDSTTVTPTTTTLVYYQRR